MPGRLGQNPIQLVIRGKDKANAMVYSEFPVEQLARLASSPFQVGFARQAIRMLEPSEAIAYDATQEGLLMRAHNEGVLGGPAASLRDLYRDALVLRPPQVRYITLDGRPYEPIMGLRVRTVPCYWDDVRADLASRETTLLEEQATLRVCTLRAEAPLRRLLGYAETLAWLSEGMALHWIWLDRYVPMGEPPHTWAA